MEIAIEVLLPQEETQMWFAHLQNIQENRKRGAEKAARTKKARSRTQSKGKERDKRKKQQPAREVTTPSVVCSTCLTEDLPGDKDEDVDWIFCDSCACWSQMVCVGITTKQVPTNWQCLSCSESWE